MKTQAILLQLISAVNAQTYMAALDGASPICRQTAADGSVTTVDGDLCCSAADETKEESLLAFC